MRLSNQRNTKAPKRRFSPGEYFREKSDKSLWCLIGAYRLQEEPSEWVYILEERKSTTSPETALSRACQSISGTPAQVIFHEPLRTGFEATTQMANQGDYALGDRRHVKNQNLINKFTRVEPEIHKLT